jgi:hypothetical protein
MIMTRALSRTNLANVNEPLIYNDCLSKLIIEIVVVYYDLYEANQFIFFSR